MKLEVEHILSSSTVVTTLLNPSSTTYSFCAVSLSVKSDKSTLLIGTLRFK